MMEVTKDGVKYDISRTGKKTKIEPSNVWLSAPESEWVYVTIPNEDLHGYVYPTIRVNDDEFEHGKKYLVPPILAAEVERIKKAFDAECIALLQPRRRMQVYSELKNGGTQLPREVSAAASA
jgi:hypothetical protein